MKGMTPAEKATNDVADEVENQAIKWGKRSNPDIDGNFLIGLWKLEGYMNAAQVNCDLKEKPTWSDILIEEVFEALVDAENNNVTDLRKELVQVAAVCISWIEDLDTRKNS